MKLALTTLILLVALLAAFAFYTFRLDAVNSQKELADKAEAAFIAKQESDVPVPSVALKNPKIKPATSAYNFLVPSEPVEISGNSMATAANQKAQRYEERASRLLNFAYEELHKFPEADAEDEGQVEWLIKTVGRQLDGARRLILAAREEATAAEWAIIGPRILRWSFTAFDKIQKDWQPKYLWIEGLLNSFREDFTDAVR